MWGSWRNYTKVVQVWNKSDTKIGFWSFNSHDLSLQIPIFASNLLQTWINFVISLRTPHRTKFIDIWVILGSVHCSIAHYYFTTSRNGVQKCVFKFLDFTKLIVCYLFLFQKKKGVRGRGGFQNWQSNQNVGQNLLQQQAILMYSGPKLYAWAHLWIGNYVKPKGPNFTWSVRKMLLVHSIWSYTSY